MNTRVKFGYLSYEDMLQRISDNKLNAYDFVFGKDTREYYIISPDLQPISIKSKIHVFNSVEEAEDSLNQNADTHIGQLVAVLDNGVYRGHIVNKNASRNKNAYTVTPLYENPNQINYNELGNIPIIQLIGTLDNIIIVEDLSSGTYKIKGHYQITSNDETIYLSTDGDILIVESLSTGISIKKITTDSIVDFKINESNSIVVDSYVTQKYLEDNGFVTNKDVDLKISALEELITKDIESYITDIIDKKLDIIIDKKIDNKLNEMITETTNEEVNNLFKIN